MTDSAAPHRHATAVVVGAGDYTGAAIAKRFAAGGSHRCRRATERRQGGAAGGRDRGGRRPNPHFPVNTVLIMRVAVAAELDGQLHPVVDAVFQGMWEDGLKMDDPAVVRTALDAAGLDGARLLARTQDQTVKDRLIQNTQRSVDRGVFGAPSFFLGEDMFFGKDRLRDLEDAIMERQVS